MTGIHSIKQRNGVEAQRAGEAFPSVDGYGPAISDAIDRIGTGPALNIGCET
jgi:hypothetical protein